MVQCLIKQEGKLDGKQGYTIRRCISAPYIIVVCVCVVCVCGTKQKENGFKVIRIVTSVGQQKEGGKQVPRKINEEMGELKLLRSVRFGFGKKYKALEPSGKTLDFTDAKQEDYGRL